MITFILPGYSSHNRDWVLETAQKLKLGHEVRPVLWDHWTDSEKSFRPESKAQDVVDVLLKDKCNIIAKSVGTLVTALTLQQIPDRIEKIILCGIPSVSEKRLEIFKDAFKNFPPEKVVCFQNFKDPLASFGEIKEFMSKVNPKIRVIEKPRSDHNYPYSSNFQEFLSNS